MLVVLAVYAFFAGGGTFDFPRVDDWEVSYYATLAEGFRQGHLYLARPIEWELMELPYPWDPAARKDIFYLWDASFFNGRYYLYFTPLPVLLLYLPFRLLRGAYPPDALVALALSAWAFIAAVVFTRRAIARSGQPPLIPFPLWVLLIGLGSVVPFTLTFARTYEIAILTGTALTSMWAVALLEFNASPTLRRTAWLSLWLALAIAARPNLLMLIPTALIVLLAVRKARRSIVKTALAFIAPLLLVALALISYNMARFHEPFESGLKYQLTSVDMANQRVCGVCNFPEVLRVANHSTHYLFRAPTILSAFPFVNMEYAKLDPAVAWPRESTTTEQVIGIAPLVPLAMIGTLFALFLAFSSNANDGVRTATQVMAGGYLVMLGLSSCWWVVARYSLDFMFLIVPSSIVCIEAGLARLRDHGVRILPLRIGAIGLACYSIVLGLLLGFGGPSDAFRTANPELFQKVASWFSGS